MTTRNHYGINGVHRTVTNTTDPDEREAKRLAAHDRRQLRLTDKEWIEPFKVEEGVR